MEFLDSGDLYQKICEQGKRKQYFQQAYIWNVFLQVVKGLEALHKTNILHRDLKSANVFLNKQGVAKLGDLNVSKVAKKGFGQTQAGTPYYASPQVWKDETYNSKSDMWSLGCVLYELVCLKPPFRAKDMEELYAKVLKGMYPRIPAHFSTDLSVLIKSLLKQQPDERPSCSNQYLVKLTGIILNLEIARRKLSQTLFLEPDESESPLLKTIKPTKEINFLTDRLPKPNYSPIKYKNILQNRSLDKDMMGIGNVKTTSSEVENHSEAINLPKLKKEIKQKIRETELIKQKLEEMLQAENRKELPKLRNRSLDLRRDSEDNNQLELPKLKNRARLRYYY